MKMSQMMPAGRVNSECHGCAKQLSCSVVLGRVVKDQASSWDFTRASLSNVGGHAHFT